MTAEGRVPAPSHGAAEEREQALQPARAAAGDAGPGPTAAPLAYPVGSSGGILAAADHATRVRLLRGLQAAGGNRSVQRLLGNVGPSPVRVQRAPGDDEEPTGAETAGGGGGEPAPSPSAGPTIAPPDLAANPYVEENEPVELTNERFTGVSGLEPIARGERELSSRDNGPAVQAVQQALLDLGYSLLAHERDGRFGGETTAAINVFRGDRGIGPGGMSARALSELDQLAPPPGERREHFLEYERLFADNRLDVTIGVGYDEGQAHVQKLVDLRAGLSGRGFTPETTEGGADPTEYEQVRPITFPTSGGERVTRDITVHVSIIAPGAGAAQRFGRALSESELTIYTGHARRGIGPDFDPDVSPAENFVIGVNSALHAAGRATAPSPAEQHHYTIDRVNDLERMTLQARRAGSVAGVTASAITIDAEGGETDEYPLTRAAAESGGSAPRATAAPPAEGAGASGEGPAAGEGASGGGGSVALHPVVSPGDAVGAGQMIASEFDPEKYRVWFLNACTTMAYMDELRGGALPAGMGRGNLDMFGTRHSVPTAMGLAQSLAMLDGVMAAQTMEQIVDAMQSRLESHLRAERVGAGGLRAARSSYFREGAGDNPVAAP